MTSSTHRGFLALLLLLATATTTTWAKEHVRETHQSSEAVSEAEFPITELIEYVREVLETYEGAPFPSLPIINIDNDQVSISISLSDIYIEGVSNFEPKPIINFPPNARAGFFLDFKKISFLVGSYTSTGHILNLPLNGEGPMHIHLHNLLAGLTFGVTLPKLCAKDNSTDYDLDLLRMDVHMENLNKGTDQGQLVDIVISSFGQDIVEQIEVLIENNFYDVLDDMVVGVVNNFLNCTSTPLEDILEPDHLTNVLADIVSELLPDASY